MALLQFLSKLQKFNSLSRQHVYLSMINKMSRVPPWVLYSSVRAGSICPVGGFSIRGHCHQAEWAVNQEEGSQIDTLVCEQFLHYWACTPCKALYNEGKENARGKMAVKESDCVPSLSVGAARRSPGEGTLAPLS